jgi:ribonuclease D
MHDSGYVISTRKLTPSKAESALLEPFVGLALERIYVPVTADDFAEATAAIKAAGVAGFDTESKPVFDRGVVSDGPHVVQFALANCAYLFQLHRAECRPYLADLLQSQAVLKVGFDLKSDRGQINAKLGVILSAVLDLNVVFRADGHRNTTGVRAAVALVFNQKFHKSKAVTTSNWAVQTLSPKQLLYAANDAYAALKVLIELDRPYDSLPIAGLTSRCLSE